MLFSVITSVYNNDRPDYVRMSLESILEKQSLLPTEVVIIRDGPVSNELESLLNEFEARYPSIIHVHRLDHNKGLGNALRLGVDISRYDYIARMDSDDLSLPNRFSIQSSFLESNPDVDIVGGQMTEFFNTPDNIVSMRTVPISNDEIHSYMKSRCGMNHVTVMFKKSSVLLAGNYQDWFWNEDYYLWIRMMIAGCTFANLPDVLVNVRSGYDQFSRRGGWKYFKSEKGIKKLQLENNMISRFEYAIYVFERFMLQVVFPSSIRGFLYRLFARKRI